MNRRTIDSGDIEFGKLLESYKVAFYKVEVDPEAVKGISDEGAPSPIGIYTSPSIVNLSINCIITSAYIFAKELAVRIGTEAALESIQSILFDGRNKMLGINGKVKMEGMDENGKEERD